MFPVFDTIRESCAEVFTHFIRGGASSGGRKTIVFSVSVICRAFRKLANRDSGKLRAARERRRSDASLVFRSSVAEQMGVAAASVNHSVNLDGFFYRIGNQKVNPPASTWENSTMCIIID